VAFLGLYLIFRETVIDRLHCSNKSNNCQSTQKQWAHVIFIHSKEADVLVVINSVTTASITCCNRVLDLWFRVRDASADDRDANPGWPISVPNPAKSTQRQKDSGTRVIGY
jgi:hypothetical protein